MENVLERVAAGACSCDESEARGGDTSSRSFSSRNMTATRFQPVSQCSRVGRRLRCFQRAARLILAAWPTVVFGSPVEVLWYTYAHPASEYVSFFSSLAGSGAGSAASYTQGAQLAWNVTFFGPSSASPEFSHYDVLVIHSGEAFRTNPPDGPLAVPNYAGILSHKNAIGAARGTRTFLSGSDADFHAVRGDSGWCPEQHCGDFDGARGYVINAVNWAALGVGLGIVSFYHGEFSGSFWWDDANSFLKDELAGKWTNFRPDENTALIPASAMGSAVNQGLSATGLSDWFHSFHAGFSGMPGFSNTVGSASRPGFALSIATIELCQPRPGVFCIATAMDEPPAALLVGSCVAALWLVFGSAGRRRRVRGGRVRRCCR